MSKWLPLLFLSVAFAANAAVIPIPNGNFEKPGTKESGTPAKPAHWKLTGSATTRNRGVSPHPGQKPTGNWAIDLAEGATLETLFKVPPVPENERKLSAWRAFVSVDLLPGDKEKIAKIQLSLLDPKTGDVIASQESELGPSPIRRVWVPLPESAVIGEDIKEFTLKIAALNGGPLVDSISACRIPSKPTKKLMGKANGKLGPDLLDCGALGFTALSVHGQNALPVIEVRAGSPAEKAGLKEGDILVGVSGQVLPPNNIAPGWIWFTASHESILGHAIVKAAKNESPVHLALLNSDATTRSIEIAIPWKGDLANNVTDLYTDLIAYLERTQRDDGSWGNNPIRTSLAGLALLGTKDQKHAASLKRAADWIFGKYPEPANFGNLGYWFAGHTSIFMAEYHHATGDPRVLPWIERNLRWAAKSWHTSKWGTRCLGHGPNGLPYGNKSLVAPTVHLMLADALAREIGIESDLWETVWPFTESAWSNPAEKSGHGALGYNKSYKDQGEFWSRTGLLLGALAVREEKPEMRTAMAKIMKERHAWIRNSHAYGEPGGALGLIGLAAHNNEIFAEVNTDYGWWYALAWEPGYGLRFTTPHMGAPYMGTDELITAAYGVVLGRPNAALRLFGNTERNWLEIPDGVGTPLSPATIRRNPGNKIILAPRVPGSDIQIAFTTDGTEPTLNSNIYTKPIDFPKGGTVKAITFREEKITPASVRTFGIPKSGWRIIDASGHADPDTAIERAQNLIDDDLAIAWRSDVGEGSPGFPHHFVIDLGGEIEIASIGLTCPSKNASPADLTITLWDSEDGDNASIGATVKDIEYQPARVIPLKPESKGRFLRIDIPRPTLDAGHSLIISELEVFPIAAPTSTAARILSYNIKHGEGMDKKLNLARTAETIRELAPDIVALQEIDNKCARSENVDQMAALGKMLGMHHAFGKFMDFGGGEYGMGMLSKYPILRSEAHRLPDGAEPRCALEIEVEIAGKRTSFVSIHLDWTKEELRLAQAKALIEKLADRDHPVVLVGDFNATRDSETLVLLSEHWAALPKSGAPKSWPSDTPEVEIDFILVPKGSPWKKVESEVIDERITSDHRPVLAVLPF